MTQVNVGSKFEATDHRALTDFRYVYPEGKLTHVKR